MDTINAEANKDKDKAEVMKGLMESAKQIDAEEKTQRFKVLSIKNHPLFSEEFDYDVALLRLDRPLDFTGPNRTTSICLPKVGDYKTTYAGSKAQVAGWGLLEDKGVESSKILQKLEVPVLDIEVCKAALSTSVITDRMLCAGFVEGGRDSCKGDSGGPLITQKSNRYFEQIGIVSWGKGCARENRPGFYSRVTELTQWIQYNSNEGVARWCKEVS
jgi:secreted trypsin-like serine protease